jgi:hypothetical protein
VPAPLLGADTAAVLGELPGRRDDGSNQVLYRV